MQGWRMRTEKTRFLVFLHNNDFRRRWFECPFHPLVNAGGQSPTDLLILFPKHTISHSSLWRVNLVKSIKGSPPLRFCFPKGRLLRLRETQRLAIFVSFSFFFFSIRPIFSLFVVTARWKSKTHSHFLTYTTDNNFEGGEGAPSSIFTGNRLFSLSCWHQTDRHSPWRAERRTSRFPHRSQNFRNDFLTTLERGRRRKTRENRRRCDMMRRGKKVAAGQKVEIRQLVFLRLQKPFAHKTDI